MKVFHREKYYYYVTLDAGIRSGIMTNIHPAAHFFNKGKLLLFCCRISKKEYEKAMSNAPDAIKTKIL